MVNHISTKGGIDPVGLDTAILQGFAEDGGLFVPETIPELSWNMLKKLSVLSYNELAYEIVSCFIDPKIIPAEDLKNLIEISLAGFEHPDVIPIVSLKNNDDILIMELFHGPTLSFKDIAMGFLINTMDYLLNRKQQHLNIILATTGDTGPAAAFASSGKKSIDCWPLYPTGMISVEQERQMTTFQSKNIHPFSVNHCKNGSDDLDEVVANLFSKSDIKNKYKLTSVNSINWCRVMFQAVHYAYGYFKVCDQIGDPVDFCVPSGAFGNLFAGFLAQKMGIPIRRFICANNQNQILHRVISTGEFVKKDLIQTISSAIDIVVPYNFWRFLYYTSGCNPSRISDWMDQFEINGKIQLDEQTMNSMKISFDSCSITDEKTLWTIKQIWETESYLLDPHGAVAMAGAMEKNNIIDENGKTICLATAHPAKFPGIILKALGSGSQDELPENAFHTSLINAAEKKQNRTVCDLERLEQCLISGMQKTI